MKTKLEMAHEYAIALINSDCEMQFDKFIRLCWNYADAMQTEADKREKEEAAQRRKEIREMLNAPNTFVEREGQHFDDVADACKTCGSSDGWQPDWSQAPVWANWWAMDENKNTRWIYSELEQPYISDMFLMWCAVGMFDSADAPSFGYTGDWRNSLRKRPK